MGKAPRSNNRQHLHSRRAKRVAMGAQNATLFQRQLAVSPQHAPRKMWSKAQINEYLFYEFGVNGEESRVRDDWPFELEPLGEFHVGDEPIDLYRFEDAGDAYFAVAGESLTFYPVDDMTPEQLVLQRVGGRWIRESEPIDL